VRNHIIGIDFSGAKDASKKIWLAAGSIRGNALEIRRCSRARDLFDPGNDRTACYRALRTYLARQSDAIVGLDFPFGLPLKIHRLSSWGKFLLYFTRKFDRAESFRHYCKKACQNEVKRETDLLTKTPFSPYNLRIYKQTYYGITEILEPLVRTKQAVVLPMQAPRSGIPWLVEICPASTLKKLNLYFPYKGRGESRLIARKKILQKICKAHSLVVKIDETRDVVVRDQNGDALDSLIAAVATLKALRDIENGRNTAVKNMAEGWVFA
jgi:hypothetical protein